MIASVTHGRVRGASHQPAFMVSYLTIRHTCFPCLPSSTTLFWSDLLVAGKVVSWERWEGSELGRWERWHSVHPPPFCWGEGAVEPPTKISKRGAWQDLYF